MRAVSANDLRKMFLEFFRDKNHAIIKSASLIPENDPTVLFTTAGMHPLVPYLIGEKHPLGTRLTNAQKCVRTGDIDEVGDNRHLTFFEMLGNWSLGDYWKKEAIEWSFEFLTSKLGMDSKRIFVTCFEGDSDAPRDEESMIIWTRVFINAGFSKDDAGKKIWIYPKSKNWWGPAGQTGPCGPDTEMFYDTLGYDDLHKHKQPWNITGHCHPNCDCGRYIEIWNDVFMQYFKNADGKFEPLKQRNVDTGMGLERALAVINGKDNVFDTELFEPIIRKIEEISGKKYSEHAKEMRIIADHIKAAAFMMADGVLPSNVEQGYILRRLIRRSIKYVRFYFLEDENIPRFPISAFVSSIVVIYKNSYPELTFNAEKIRKELEEEEERFLRLLKDGYRVLRDEANKMESVFSVLTSINTLSENEKVPSSIISSAEDVFEDFDTIKNAFELHNSGEHKKAAETAARIVSNGLVIKNKLVFDLFQSHGFPMEMVKEEMESLYGKRYKVDISACQEMFKHHQELSRAGAEQKFSGGLADHSERVVRMHTATHLLHQSLRKVLGEHVYQKGSNITQERLRFDFSHPQKMTPEEVKRVEEMINEQVKKDLPVRFEFLTVTEAKKLGAIGLFEDKYAQLGDKVKVYFIGDDEKGYFSKEICGGPHVTHTGEVGKVKIVKEEAVSAGVRRIKAVVE